MVVGGILLCWYGMNLFQNDEVVERRLEQKADTALLQGIDVATETIQLAGTATTSPEGLASEISETEPRYSFYRYSDETGERGSPPIVFIYTCPTGSKIKERMIYASSKLAFVEAVKAEAGLDIVKKVNRLLMNGGMLLTIS